MSHQAPVQQHPQGISARDWSHLQPSECTQVCISIKTSTLALSQICQVPYTSWDETWACTVSSTMNSAIASRGTNHPCYSTGWKKCADLQRAVPDKLWNQTKIALNLHLISFVLEIHRWGKNSWNLGHSSANRSRICLFTSATDWVVPLSLHHKMTA